METGELLRLTIEEARGLMLAAQGLLHPPAPTPDLQAVQATVERLGVVQIDTINVVERSQYLVLWSRLGAYDAVYLDALLYPQRAVLEYWCHAASIVPMTDYPYHRAWMLHHAEHMWSGHNEWMQANPGTLQETLESVRTRGPVASADFDRQPGAVRSGPWDWHGPKASRRALEILWTTGDLMVHSRRGGQKVYDLRERVLAQALNGSAPRDEHVPGLAERRQYFARRTVQSLGVTTPSWLWDYYRLPASKDKKLNKRSSALAQLEELQQEGVVAPATIAGLDEPVFITTALLPELATLRAGNRPTRTTLLSPFDSLIWDRIRARALFHYEVCFEAYVPPPRRRYGYYCLAILHQGRLVGRLDPKMDRAAKRLLVRALYLEPDTVVDDALLDGLAGALRDQRAFSVQTTFASRRPGNGWSQPPLASAYFSLSARVARFYPRPARPYPLLRCVFACLWDLQL